MKKIFRVILAVCLLEACSNQNNKQTAIVEKDSVKEQPVEVDSLTANFVKNFQIGDPAYAQEVLNFYADYDANRLDSVSKYFADTVTLDLANGEFKRLSRDSAISFFKTLRNKFSKSMHIV